MRKKIKLRCPGLQIHIPPALHRGSQITARDFFFITKHSQAILLEEERGQITLQFK